MSERILITKLVREGDRADLFGRGHQYKDLTLFTLSDLADVGIDYANLEPGEETPCRFWAVYELSDKLNKAGNPYKDIIALEAVDSPATTTSTDTSALLDEMRAIRALLQIIAEGRTVVAAPGDEPPPEPAKAPVPVSAGNELDQALGRAGNGSALNGTSEAPARRPKDLLDAVNPHMDLPYQNLGDLYAAISARIGPTWRWPAYNDTYGWQRAYNAALGLPLDDRREAA